MRAFLACAFLLAGCFDSIVSNQCADGFSYESGQCVAGGDGSDGSGGSGGGGGGGMHGVKPESVNPPELVCTAPEVKCSGMCIDITTDADNCGACGHVCASGLCSNSKCVGGLGGHIVAIGHDYRHFHAAMARVLGNAVALGKTHDLAVARWHGTSVQQAVAGTTQALGQSLQLIGRPWHAVTLGAEPTSTVFDGIDVLLVDAQTGDGDAEAADGVSWSPAIGAFLDRGGVVVVLEGTAGTSYRFAEGAGLYSVGAPTDVTNHTTVLADTTDAVTQLVPSPYLAEGSSVALTGATSPVITTDDGQPLVLHITN
jgi:hypothetical protein